MNARADSRAAATLAVDEVVWVVAALMLALAPHLERFPPVLSFACIGAALWRVLGALGRLPLPDRAHRLLWLLKQILAVGAFVAIYVAYHGRLGREAGVELLAALLGLKLLEMHGERDYYVVTFLCYFLVVTNFFYSQTLATALYMLFVVVVVTGVLVQYNTPPAWRRTDRALALSARLTAQAVPFMLIAFVLFPRIPGPLWGLPQDAFDAVSGLSEDMSIGHIARLALSDEIAFRVEFTGPAPHARDRYWRGPVLWVTDGRNWQLGASGYGRAAPLATQGPYFDYHVMLEPHRKRWLFGLEMVTVPPPAAELMRDRRLLSRTVVTRRLRYAVRSATTYQDRDLGAAARAAGLALPRGAHPRTRELAEGWRAAGLRERGLVDTALDHIRTQGYNYSLTPPPLPGDSIDEFLFDTRTGFCEHFAAAFVVLMRAAGLPARVVTGYQGGEFNAVGGYLVVRQRDAHAWAEVYLEDAGWVRVDPTAAVAPERVALGSGDALPQPSPFAAFDRAGVAARAWRQLAAALDAAAYGWNRWVLGYSPQQQRRLLDALGLEDWDYGNLVIALTVALAAAAGVLALAVLRAARRARDPLVALYATFCSRLARAGVVRRAGEPPLAFARRAMLARADLAADISTITRLYTELRYGRRTRDIAALRACVRRFKPGRRR